MPRTPNAQQLLDALLEAPHPLETQLAAWLEVPSFRAFVQAHESKIRRKLRLARDAESQAAVAWELEIAFRLVQVPGFAVAYELGGTRAMRLPDFTITFRGHTTIGVEATRMRTSEREPDYAATKLGDVVLAKLGQLRADAPNLLAVQVAEPTFAQLDLVMAFRTLTQRVERREEAVLARRGLENPAAFYRLFRRLNAVIAATPGAPPKLWFNSQAQRPLPDDARKQIVKTFERLDV